MNPEPHVQENIPAYLAGELDEAELRTVELHLRECDSCRRELEDQKRLDEILSQAQTLSPRPELMQGVMQQVRLNRKPAFFRRRLILPWLAAAAVIAVILFLLRIQKDTPLPGEVVKKSPIVKPDTQPQPKPKLEPVQPELESVPQVTKKDEKVAKPLPNPIEEKMVPALTAEEAEVVAQLDELENMELISNYENLENLELALIGEGNESLK